MDLKAGEGLSSEPACRSAIARHELRNLNKDGQKDILGYFPELKAPDKKAWDEDAINDILKDWTSGNLARICAAAGITRSRRQYSGSFSIKLSKEAQRDYAMLTGGLADYLGDIIKLQNAECKGCTRAISDKVGTGKECCSSSYGHDQHGFNEQGKCNDRSTRKGYTPAVIDDEDDDDPEFLGTDDGDEED